MSPCVQFFKLGGNGQKKNLTGHPPPKQKNLILGGMAKQKKILKKIVNIIFF